MALSRTALLANAFALPILASLGVLLGGAVALYVLRRRGVDTKAMTRRALVAALICPLYAAAAQYASMDAYWRSRGLMREAGIIGFLITELFMIPLVVVLAGPAGWGTAMLAAFAREGLGLPPDDRGARLLRHGAVLLAGAALGLATNLTAGRPSN